MVEVSPVGSARGAAPVAKAQRGEATSEATAAGRRASVRAAAGARAGAPACWTRACVRARLAGLVGSLLGDGRRILRLFRERRQRSEQQGCRDGCSAKAAGQGARGGHEATSTRAAECSTGRPRPAGTPSAGSAGEAAA